MSIRWEFILAAAFLLLIPVNVYVAVRVHRFAWARPRIALLVLLSRIVTTLAIVSCLLGVLSTNAVLFLLTGIRLIPTPFPTALLVLVLVWVSALNGLVWLYLRSKPEIAE